MSEHHAITTAPGTHPTANDLVKVFCPECQRYTENALSVWEFVEGRRTLFCGRWSCDALIHAHLRSAR